MGRVAKRPDHEGEGQTSEEENKIGSDSNKLTIDRIFVLSVFVAVCVLIVLGGESALHIPTFDVGGLLFAGSNGVAGREIATDRAMVSPAAKAPGPTVRLGAFKDFMVEQSGPLALKN